MQYNSKTFSSKYKFKSNQKPKDVPIDFLVLFYVRACTLDGKLFGHIARIAFRRTPLGPEICGAFMLFASWSSYISSGCRGE